MLTQVLAIVAIPALLINWFSGPKKPAFKTQGILIAIDEIPHTFHPMPLCVGGQLLSTSSLTPASTRIVGFNVAVVIDGETYSLICKHRKKYKPGQVVEVLCQKHVAASGLETISLQAILD